MSATLQRTVERELSRIHRRIADKTREIASLRNDLRKYQKVMGLVAPTNGRRRGRQIRWDRVLAGLPPAFSLRDLAAADGASEKSRPYLQQVLQRWKRKGVVARRGRGLYRKVTRAGR